MEKSKVTFQQKMSDYPFSDELRNQGKSLLVALAKNPE
jgi:hypothetical protein